MVVPDRRPELHLRAPIFPLKPSRSPADFEGVTQRNVNGRIGIENGTRRFGSGATAGEVRVSPSGNDAFRNGNGRRDIDHGGRSNDIAAARHVNGMTPKHNGARRIGNGGRILALQGFCNRLGSIRREPDHLSLGKGVIRLTPDATANWSARSVAAGMGSAIGVLELFTIDVFNLN